MVEWVFFLEKKTKKKPKKKKVRMKKFRALSLSLIINGLVRGKGGGDGRICLYTNHQKKKKAERYVKSRGRDVHNYERNRVL